MGSDAIFEADVSPGAIDPLELSNRGRYGREVFKRKGPTDRASLLRSRPSVPAAVVEALERR
ncbi:MAG: hypothetical protein ABSH08_21320, partial [Tepidisphaeraceae bacterium]